MYAVTKASMSNEAGAAALIEAINRAFDIGGDK